MVCSLANFQVADHFHVHSSSIKIGTCLQISWRQLVIILIEHVGHYLCIVWFSKSLAFSAVCPISILGHTTSPTRQGLLITVHMFCNFQYNALQLKLQGISTLLIVERRGSVWETNLKLSTGSCRVRVSVTESNYFLIRNSLLFVGHDGSLSSSWVRHCSLYPIPVLQTTISHRISGYIVPFSFHVR